MLSLQANNYFSWWRATCMTTWLKAASKVHLCSVTPVLCHSGRLLSPCARPYAPLLLTLLKHLYSPLMRILKQQ